MPVGSGTESRLPSNPIVAIGALANFADATVDRRRDEREGQLAATGDLAVDGRDAVPVPMLRRTWPRLTSMRRVSPGLT